MPVKPMTRRVARPRAAVAILLALSSLAGPGCSEGPPPAPRKGYRLSDFRKINFAGDTVVIPFRGGLPTSTIPDLEAGYVPKPGDDVVLADVGDGEVFAARDLEALQFYHSSPGPDQLGKFRALGDEGRLFIVARGTVGSVARVVEDGLPLDLRAVELRLPGEKVGVAWVSESFVRRSTKALGPPQDRLVPQAGGFQKM